MARPQKFRPALLAAAVCACFAAQLVQAMPTGAQVIAGQAGFSQNGNALTISNTPGAIINWQGFSVGTNELVRFQQQNSASAILNRVIGTDASRILGALHSNGQVYLINPNGILFGPNAKIDVAGLIASTLAISDSDFRAGRLKFEAGAVAGGVKNEGQISTANGGKVFLIAPDIENSGVIRAPGGEVMLAAGHSVDLLDLAHPDVRFTLTAPDTAATNLGQILVEGGRANLFGALVRQRGRISADTVTQDAAGRIVFKASKNIEVAAGSQTTANGGKGGEIVLQAGGDTLVSGQVSATGSAGAGGAIDVLGNRVGVLDHAVVDASGQGGGGRIRMGGDYQGKNPEVQNAYISYFGPDATLQANALQSGDGGRVIVWGNDVTRAYGTISARGNNGGKGGFVETSGRHLDTSGIRLSLGRGGTWLLDPDDITIGAVDSGNITAAPMFSSTDSAPATVAAATIMSQLDVGTEVTVTSSTGDIYVNTAITKSAGIDVGLILNAHDDIFVNAPISSTTNKLNVTLTANKDSNGPSGQVFINSGGSISTNGGYLAAYGKGITVNDTINAPTTGYVTFWSTGAISLGANIAAFNLILNAGSGVTQSAGKILGSTDVELMGTGNFSLGNQNDIGKLAGTVNGNIDVMTNGSLTVDSVNGSNSLTSSSGNIVLQTSGNMYLYKPIAAAGAVKLSSLGSVGDYNGAANNVTASSLDIQSHNGGTLHSQVATLSGGELTYAVGAAPSAFTAINAGDLTINGVAIGAVAAGIDAPTQAASLVSAINLETSNNGVSAFVAAGNNVVLKSSTGGITLALAGTADITTTGLTAGTTSPTAGTFGLGNTGAVSLNGFYAPGSLILTTTGGVTQSNPLTAGTLTINAGGFVNLSTSTNSVTNLVGSVAPSYSGTTPYDFRFKNGTVLNIANPGISIGLGTYSYNSSSPYGVISLETVTGNITQSAGANLAGAAVLAKAAAGSVNLATVANPTGVIAGSASTGFAYTSANSISVTNVEGEVGISNTAGTVALTATNGGKGIGTDTTAGATITSPTVDLTAASGIGVTVTNATSVTATNGSVGTPASKGVSVQSTSAGNGNLSIQVDQYIGAPSSPNTDIYVSHNGPIITAGAGIVSNVNGANIYVSSTGPNASNKSMVTATNAIPIKTLNSGRIAIEADEISFTGAGAISTSAATGTVHVVPYAKNSPSWQIGGTGYSCGSLPCYLIADLQNITSEWLFLGAPNGTVTGDLHLDGLIDFSSFGLTGLGTGGMITKNNAGVLTADTLILKAGTNIYLGEATQAANHLNQLAAYATSGPTLSLKNDQAFTIPASLSLPAGDTLATYPAGVGTPAAGATVNLSATAGNITIAGTVMANATNGSVIIAAPAGGIVSGGGSIQAHAADLSASGGIGHAGTINTQVGLLTAANTGANTNIDITNTGVLTVQSATQNAGSTGSITIDNTGALTVNTVTTDAGAITLTAHSPLTVSGPITSTSGNIVLAALSNGSPDGADTLTINGSVSTGGTLDLQSGDAMTINVIPTAASITKTSFLDGTPPPTAPTLAQCTADPTLSGCSTVLPTLSTCTATPTAAGCSAVLPSLSTCTTSPTTAGCTAVLPSVDSCTTNPTATGCSAVLPTLGTCTTAPSTLGCSVVLPSLSTCTTSPTTAGCTAVLPSVDSCTTNPTATGCTAVLPTLSTCTATPTAAGCSAILPSLSTCTTSPTTAGCTAVLPSVDSCTTNPTASGCTAVLPTLSTCTTAPTTLGCSVVLPSLSTCTATPTAAGCTAVLPTAETCLTNPSAPGCTVVLPVTNINSCLTGTDGCTLSSTTQTQLQEQAKTLDQAEQQVVVAVTSISTQTTSTSASGGFMLTTSPGSGSSSGGGSSSSGSGSDSGNGKKRSDDSQGFSAQGQSTGSSRPTVRYCN